MEHQKQITLLFNHITAVQRNCFKLAGKLYEDSGSPDLSRQLVINSLRHDESKFYGAEWEYLNEEAIKNDIDNFKFAAKQHVENNFHHPEFYGNCVAKMPEINIAEMVCDWQARSDEFGNNLYDWIDTVAVERFGLLKEKEKYKLIMKYADILNKS